MFFGFWLLPEFYHLNLASADFTTSAALQGICGSILQLHTLRLAYAANSTPAKFRYHHNDLPRLTPSIWMFLKIQAYYFECAVG
jgi:hypothetical protein